MMCGKADVVASLGLQVHSPCDKVEKLHTDGLDHSHRIHEHGRASKGLHSVAIEKATPLTLPVMNVRRLKTLAISSLDYSTIKISFHYRFNLRLRL